MIDPSTPRPEMRDLERHRAELTGYCYRMLGSAFEAEDAVQDTLVRAWRALDRFEGRSSLRSWLYRIATRVCLDLLDGRKRRARPIDLGPAAGPEPELPAPLGADAWIEPVPDHRVLSADGDPALLAMQRQTIRLAFVAALQHLPPKQRAVLILREVLSLSAAEVAELLETTVPSVNSALQRARATLESVQPSDEAPPVEVPQDLLNRYVDAFERYDLDQLTTLLHEDATLQMPPFPLWLRGPAAIRSWMLGIGAHCRGSRLIPTSANGLPAFGQYRPSGPNGEHRPWALIVLEVSGGRIGSTHTFLDTARFFPLFGLPPTP